MGALSAAMIILCLVEIRRASIGDAENVRHEKRHQTAGWKLQDLNYRQLWIPRLLDSRPFTVNDMKITILILNFPFPHFHVSHFQ